MLVIRIKLLKSLQRCVPPHFKGNRFSAPGLLCSSVISFTTIIGIVQKEVVKRRGKAYGEKSLERTKESKREKERRTALL